MTTFTAPENTKYQSVPLVDIQDLVSTDSKKHGIRRDVSAYLTTKDATQKERIVQQLKQWKEASLQIPSIVKNAPNLKTLETYSTKLVQAIDVGLQVLENTSDEQTKTALLQTLKGLKGRGDKLEILVLPEIEALVTGTLAPWPTSLSPF